MKRLLVLAVLALSGIAVGVSSAAQPASPGCFGKDRAAGVQALGGSTWGAIAADRAGTNGDLNQAYKDSCGGSPA
jgi:hypothetical protein